MTSVSTTVGARRHLRVPLVARLTGRTALATLVAALVMGILGMHALASHGTPAAATALTDASAMSMPGTNSAHHAALTSAEVHEVHPCVVTATGTSMSGVGPDSGSEHGIASMVMLCVVMLAAAAPTWLVLLVAGVLRPLLPAAFWPAAAPQRALRRLRGAGPPSAWQFSVIRC